MPLFELEGPDGAKYEVDAPDEHSAVAAFKKMTTTPAAPQPTAADFQSGGGAFSDAAATDMPSPAGSTPAGTPEPSLSDKLGRSFMLAGQNIGRGAAGVAGAIPDLAGFGIDTGLNLAEWGLNKIPGVDIDLPQLGQMPMGKQHLIDSASNLADAAGVPTVDRGTMNSTERMVGNAAEFGTEAALGGALLNNVAKARFPNGQTAGVTPRTGDAFLAPYIKDGSGAVMRDTAAGIGSGIGLTTAQDIAPDSPITQLLGMLAGGFGGATLANLPGTVKSVGRLITESAPSDVPYDAGGILPTSRRTVENTRRFLNEQMTNPSGAVDRVRERIDDARQFGDPMPTTGTASDDIGLVAMERGMRNKNTVPFEERDQRLLDSAQERISGLKDDTIDPNKAGEFVRNRPDDLAQQRDAAALPLLRQAEQSGATVNAQPVADLIDQKLATSKRPPVVNALREARKLLNAPGTEDLDTSVSGLYETRKAINDIIEGRSENTTGRFAKSELIEVRDALDSEINRVAPEFGQYLNEFRTGSRPIDLFKNSPTLKSVADESDIRNVAKRVFSNNEYGTEHMLKDINTALSGDPEAMRAWKAAVSEVLADKVTNTNTALTKTKEGPLSVAKLQNVLKMHEGELAQIYNPDEMNAIRRAHKMLEPLGNLARKSSVGSPTETNRNLVNGLEAAVLAYTGNAIQTGMVMRRLRTMANLTPGLKEITPEAKMQKLIDRMMFDPELFVHVMETPPRAMETPAWNAKLNRLIGYTEAVRGKEDREKQ